jgi:excinuclease UvrABC helicase subunit UvrB
VAEVDVTDPESVAKAITGLEQQMSAAAERLGFEEAAALRDAIEELRAQPIYTT